MARLSIRHRACTRPWSVAGRARTAIRDTRGIALPLALVSLLLFSALALALIAVAQTEPVIATNHLHAAQARALAESGLAWAIRALNETGTVAGAGTFLALGGTGGFELTLAGADPHLRVVRSTGWRTGSGRPSARAAVVATIVRVRDLAWEAPCALCVGGAVTLAASVADARGSETTGCGPKTGVASAAGIEFGASGAAYGAGAPAGAAAAVEGRDWRQHQPLGDSLSADDLQTLRALAVVRGTYVRPASEVRMRLTGLRDGLVFVDTPGGTPPGAGNLADVAIGPPPFRGWLIVNGNLTLEAGADIEGAVYAANALASDGPAAVTGIVVARHVLGGSAAPLTALSVRFDCAAARAERTIPRGWFVRPGTYCDGTAGC